MRVGTGYDVHRLVAGRKLVLGGVQIDWTLGLGGHSDADVLLHSVMDALLGAAGLEDIGIYFPDNDQRYKDISSLKLLAKVGQLIKEEGFKIINIDSTIIAQSPKVAPFILQMKEKIAVELGMDKKDIGIKATTTEGLGPFGRGEGIAAQSVVLLQ